MLVYLLNILKSLYTFRAMNNMLLPQFMIKAKIWLGINTGKPMWCTFNHSADRMQLLQIPLSK